MQKLRKTTAVLLAALLLLGSISLLSGAQEANPSGTCGPYATWSLDLETGVLAINGKESMKHYGPGSGDPTTPPWSSWKDEIKEVQFGINVYNVGNYAFAGCSNLVKFSGGHIGNFKSIGIGAFKDCAKLTDIVYYKNITSIGDEAFSGCAALENFNLPDGIATLGKNAYRGTNLKVIFIPAGITALSEGLFSSCAALRAVYCPNDKLKFSDSGNSTPSTVFAGSPNVKLYGNRNSGALDYGYEKSIPAAQVVTINPTELFNMTNGDETTLTAAIAPDYPVAGAPVFKATGFLVIVLDSNGKVTARNAGDATVTASTPDGKFKDVCEIKVENTDERTDLISRIIAWFQQLMQTIFELFVPKEDITF